jgi:hypothetical protein
MPFISLPVPGLEKITSVQKAVDDIRLMIEELKGKVAEVRAGAVDKIGVVTEIALRIADRSGQVADNLAVLDEELEGFQQTLAAVRGSIPSIFIVVAFLITLVLVYVAYTQVEVVRLFVGRWKLMAAETAEAPALPEAASVVDETPVPETEEEPPAEAAGEDKSVE